jgi:hypothetical protein
VVLTTGTPMADAYRRRSSPCFRAVAPEPDSKSYTEFITTPCGKAGKIKHKRTAAKRMDCWSNPRGHWQPGTRELLHPKNRHTREKIHQQLQVLRAAGFLTHIILHNT